MRYHTKSSKHHEDILPKVLKATSSKALYLYNKLTLVFIWINIKASPPPFTHTYMWIISVRSTQLPASQAVKLAYFQTFIQAPVATFR